MGRAGMEKIMEVPEGTKSGSSVWFSSPTPRHRYTNDLPVCNERTVGSVAVRSGNFFHLPCPHCTGRIEIISLSAKTPPSGLSDAVISQKVILSSDLQKTCPGPSFPVGIVSLPFYGDPFILRESSVVIKEIFLSFDLPDPGDAPSPDIVEPGSLFLFPSLFEFCRADFCEDPFFADLIDVLPDLDPAALSQDP